MHTMPFDLKTAVTLGKLVNLAYGTPLTPVPADPAAPPLGAANLSLQNFIYANDPWDAVPGYVPYGFIAKSNPPDGLPVDLFVILRGTANLWDWFKDFEFWRVPCPISGAPAGAETEDGFTTLFETLRGAPDEAASPLASTIRGLLTVPPALAVGNLYVAGHSLGGALATLVAVQLAAQQIGPSPTLYTFASPAVGEKTFATWVDHLVPNSYRIANSPDIVPGTPPAVLGFQHVDELYPINSGATTKPTIACHHSLATYLSLLEPANCKVDPECAP